MQVATETLPEMMRMPPPLAWQTAVIERIAAETARARTFTLRLAEPRPFRAGQHYDVRLTAPDGYQAQRSYSIANAPPADGSPAQRIDLTIELIPDGEVSPYFHEAAQPGDTFEVRGPIGGPFTWPPGADTGGGRNSLLLLAGGSGIVPIHSIMAHREAVAPEVPALLLYSARSRADIIYRRWLDCADRRRANAVIRYTLTRQPPAGWTGYARRVDPAMLRECIRLLTSGPPTAGPPLCYACGPTGFVETAADALLAIGIPDRRIRTERFGPTA